MATGMVLVIVSRNIDLSVGSLLGFLGYTMAMVQITWIPLTLGLGLEQPYTWIVTVSSASCSAPSSAGSRASSSPSAASRHSS